MHRIIIDYHEILVADIFLERADDSESRAPEGRDHEMKRVACARKARDGHRLTTSLHVFQHLLRGF